MGMGIAYVQCPQRPKGGIRSSEARVTCHCEVPNMNAGEQTLVLCKSSMYQLLSHLSTPCVYVCVYGFLNEEFFLKKEILNT